MNIHILNFIKIKINFKKPNPTRFGFFISCYVFIIKFYRYVKKNERRYKITESWTNWFWVHD